MSLDGLGLLTDKEREALRLVPLHGTLGEIATHLGISESAVKQRFASACRKLGVAGRRHKAARILLEAEGWPYPDRTGLDRQVEQTADSSFPAAVDDLEGRDLGEALKVTPSLDVSSLGIRLGRMEGGMA